MLLWFACTCTYRCMHACTHARTQRHARWGDTVTVIRSSQASACACNVTWSLTFYMTVGHLAVNLCHSCPLSVRSGRGGVRRGKAWWWGRVVTPDRGVSRRPAFDLCYRLYCGRHCNGTLGLWKGCDGWLSNWDAACGGYTVKMKTSTRWNSREHISIDRFFLFVP